MQTESFCRALGFKSFPATQPVARSEIPILLICGFLDDRILPAYAEDARRGFPHAEHVIVKYGGHELLPEPKVQDLVSAFLQDRPRSAALELEKPAFATIEEAKQPPRRARQRPVWPATGIPSASARAAMPEFAMSCRTHLTLVQLEC